ncbi:alcohol dehydrogenase family protein [Persicobacter diffluens]|uniref:Alcohol dehydrogenase n=1 Tax=Persicobacter diffluens TaxID=981 RepID=A0AAN5AL68_9BACT|nr:alcohol dehydrogenase [Persicobacter diffluens]
MNNMEAIPEKMFGVYLKGHGDESQLEYREDIPVPSIGDHEVLIKVSAAGVNNTDINTRIAWYSKGEGEAEDASWSGEALKFPRIQGADVCGHIVGIGKAINERRLGERIIIEPSLQQVNGEALEHAWYFGSECDGGFAQYTKVDGRHAFAVHTEMTDQELASFPCSYSTAENLLTRAQVTAQDTVLITGASGGVGSAAVQLAKARGAKVIAVVGAAKAQDLLNLGADQVIHRGNSLTEAIGHSSVEVVIDLVAGPAFAEILEILKPKGRYAVAGAIGGAEVPMDIRTVYLKDLSLFGCTVLEPEVFPNLVRVIESGLIKGLVAETFALKDITKAQEVFQQKQHIGKLVINMNL